MKYLIHILALSFLLSLVTMACPPDWDMWLRQREDDFAKVMELPDVERIPELGLLLRISAIEPAAWVTGSAKMYSSKNFKNKLYFFNKVQPQLLAIPGHAKYYANRIQEANEAYWNPDSPLYSGSVGRFSTECTEGFATLRNLPSAETVQIIGEMLNDEREQKQNSNSDVPPPKALAKYAVTTLTLMHLRDTPSPPIHQYAANEVLINWQAWYAEVKSGKRTFSFKGQAVEYRFKPDRTWDTIPITNPPDDAVQLSAPEDNKPEAKAVSQAASDKSWFWVIIAAFSGGAVLVSLLVWKKKVRS